MSKQCLSVSICSLPFLQTIPPKSLCYYGQWWSSSLCPSLVPRWWTCPRFPSQSYFCHCRVVFHLEQQDNVWILPDKSWFKPKMKITERFIMRPHARCNLPESPNSPNMLMKTSASVPLPLTSAVKTLTTYLLSEKWGPKVLRVIWKQTPEETGKLQIPTFKSNNDHAPIIRCHL